MILESDSILWKNSKHEPGVSAYFEFKQMNPRKFGPYTLIKNYLESYVPLFDKVEIVYPYIYDFDGIKTLGSKYMIVGIIKKTEGQLGGAIRFK